MICVQGREATTSVATTGAGAGREVSLVSLCYYRREGTLPRSRWLCCWWEEALPRLHDAAAGGRGRGRSSHGLRHFQADKGADVAYGLHGSGARLFKARGSFMPVCEL